MGLPDPFGRPAPVPAPASPKPMPRTPASNPAPHMANHACSTQTSAATKHLAPPRAIKQPHGHNPQLVLCSIALGSHRPARATHLATMGKSPFSRSHLGESHCNEPIPSHGSNFTTSLSHCKHKPPTSHRQSQHCQHACTQPAPNSRQGHKCIFHGRWNNLCKKTVTSPPRPRKHCFKLTWGNTSHLPQRHSPSSGANTPQPTPQHHSQARAQG